jgi:hypothetical protein
MRGQNLELDAQKASDTIHTDHNNANHGQSRADDCANHVQSKARPEHDLDSSPAYLSIQR